MATTDPLVLLQEQRPDSLFLEQLYDPDVDGTDPAASGKIIPGLGSLVIDRARQYALYAVAAVDPVTYKSTLVPVKLPEVVDTTEKTRLISYGNDRFVIYFDDRVKPTKLAIDGKLLLFGGNNVEYRLYKKLTDGTSIPISMYVDADGKILGDRIPLADVPGLVGAKYCTNCHTNHVMNEGDILQLIAFDTLGVETINITMFVVRSVILNDLASSNNPIVGFDADCLQMRGEEFFLYEKQDPSTLGVTPYIDYADGTREIVPVNNMNCFLYGLDEVIPSYPGYKHRLTIKLFLSDRQPSPIAEGDGRHRFLIKTKWVTVLQNTADYGGKISLVPVWNAVAKKYDLKFFFYSNKRDKLYDITTAVTMETPYDGALYDRVQALTYSVDLSSFFDSVVSIIYRQSTWLKLSQFATFERYTLKDSSDDAYTYGVDAPGLRRPTIHYDTTLQQYYIPTSVFANTAAFLEAFYYRAHPAFNLHSESEPVVPTHFTIRSIATGNTIITTPIPVDQYNQAWNIVLNGTADQLVGGNVIVEFLALVNGSYQILYGVPVDVFTSILGYNTENNNL